MSIEGQEKSQIFVNLLFQTSSKLLRVSVERENNKEGMSEQVYWYGLSAYSVRGKDGDFVPYWLLIAFLTQAIIFGIIMFTKVPRAQIASKTMFISFFCLLDCANFTARMHREPAKTVIFIPLVLLGCVTALMPLNWKELIIPQRYTRAIKIKDLEIDLNGEVQEKKLTTALGTNNHKNKKKSKQVEDASEEKVESTPTDTEEESPFYFLLTFYGKTNLILFIILIIVNFGCQYLRPSWMTYTSHISVYSIFFWEIIDQKIELPHAFLTLGSIFCYTGLQFILRGVKLPLVDLPLSHDIPYLVIEGVSLFLIFNAIFYIDSKHRRSRLRQIAVRKKLPKVAPKKVVDPNNIVGGQFDDDWEAGRSNQGDGYAQV